MSRVVASSRLAGRPDPQRIRKVNLQETRLNGGGMAVAAGSVAPIVTADVPGGPGDPGDRGADDPGDTGIGDDVVDTGTPAAFVL